MRSALLSGLFATHPPLVERIRRIDPTFDGDFSKVRLLTVDHDVREPEGRATLRPQTRPGRGTFRFNPADMIVRVGTIDPQQLAYAQAMLGGLPDPLRALAYEPFGAARSSSRS